MDTYAIFRRNGWRSPEALEADALRSRHIGDSRMHDDVRWIRSYVLVEGNGSLGTVCIYLARDPDAIHRHSEAARLPVHEIRPVADTVIVRPDPLQITA